MKTKTKALTLVLCAVLLVVSTVFVTMAYLTDQDSVTNTFTVGQVNITLDETDVDLMGVKDSDSRVKKNDYKLLPGHSYTKDPTVHIQPNSEASYVRLLVTLTNVNNASAVLDKADDGTILLQNYVNWNSEKWSYEGCTPNATNNTATYEFRYNGVVSANNGETAVDLEMLFTTITMPGTLNNDDIKKLDGVQINVVAHAIQSDGFDTAAAAWAAFDNK